MAQEKKQVKKEKGILDDLLPMTQVLASAKKIAGNKMDALYKEMKKKGMWDEKQGKKLVDKLSKETRKLADRLSSDLNTLYNDLSGRLKPKKKVSKKKVSKKEVSK